MIDLEEAVGISMRIQLGYREASAVIENMLVLASN